MPIEIKITTNSKDLRRSLSEFQRKLLPRTMAAAVNSIAVDVAKEETRNLAKVFPTLTRFTLNSIALRRASPSSPTAYVFVKDIAAKYLHPFEFGGRHDLGTKKALLMPRKTRLDQYGNIPKSALARYKGRKDHFIAEVNGTYGVWQRVRPVGKSFKHRGAVKAGERLKLVISFDQPKEVRQHLGYFETASRVVAQRGQKAFAAAFDRLVSKSR